MQITTEAADPFDRLAALGAPVAAGVGDAAMYLGANPVAAHAAGVALVGIAGAAGVAFLRLSASMLTVPRSLDRVSAAMLRMAATAQTAGGEMAAGETAAKSGLLGIAGAVSSVAAIFGGPLMLHILAAQISAKRSAAGTNAAERNQYGQINSFGHMHLYDAKGKLSPTGEYTASGVKLDANALAKIRQYNPVGQPSVRAPRTGGAHSTKQVSMTNHFHYNAPAGGDPAANKRAAMAAHRAAAQQLAEVDARESRTGIRAAGSAPQMWGMSPFEVLGSTV